MPSSLSYSDDCEFLSTLSNMWTTSGSKYFYNLPYCLSSGVSDPSFAFARVPGWLSPAKLYGYAYPMDRSSTLDAEDPEVDVTDEHITYSKRRLCTMSSRRCQKMLRLASVFALFLTAVILLHVWLSRVGLQPDPFDKLFPLDSFGSNNKDDNFDSRWVSFMQHVLPVRCHSHNDYLRRTPLFAALASGCTSIEADIWALDNELYVGHDSASLTPEATLRSLYLDPLQRMLQAANTKSKFSGISTTDGFHGVFSSYPDQTLVLLVDFKTDRPSTYEFLYAELTPLREAGWLTHWNGTHRVTRPLTVVTSGEASYEQIVSNTTYRDIFLDAPLHKLVDPEDSSPPPQASDTTLVDSPTVDDSSSYISEDILGFKYNPSNSYYASMDIRGIMRGLAQYRITTAQIALLQGQVREARLRGLVPRYWGTPRWPRNFRDYTWEILMESDVGILNVDDLRAARKGSWGHWTQ